ncbi:endonuclease domain-containing 1 protein-like [Epinephelus fuscoguttatus]|uniref:endonuclease domain-containing 1 protein-like n=1 Tax=Epinephelus fuscoguttatus TaxID=293821 RepID=UPI0020D06678|nr:endonuclease domain-containing 1 protein-like [Epinephelus fuscoguttatus]
MCCLLPLAALLLLSIVPSVTEVVQSMSKCSEFLLEQTPPNVPGVLEGGEILDKSRYKVICQTLSNVRTFVTVYDTQNRIPVFSASKYTGVDGGKRPSPNWKIEPQLEDIDSNKNMIPVSKNKTYNNQAGDNDYKDQTVYDRGHLFPCSYGATENDRKATFTLTNIVPQEGIFNKGSWQKMESCVKCVLDEYCKNNDITEGFLVIGAQPGNDKLKDRVNIPSMLWSAFCCYSQSENTWLASAHWGENIKDSSEYLQTKTLAELYKKLSTQDSVFEVFPGTQCPLSTTVTQFYPKLKKTCQCPPLISTTSASPTTTATSPVFFLFVFFPFFC